MRRAGLGVGGVEACRVSVGVAERADCLTCSAALLEKEARKGEAKGGCGRAELGSPSVWTLMGSPLTKMPLRRTVISARALSGCPSHATASASLLSQTS